MRSSFKACGSIWAVVDAAGPEWACDGGDVYGHRLSRFISNRGTGNQRPRRHRRRLRRCQRHSRLSAAEGRIQADRCPWCVARMPPVSTIWITSSGGTSTSHFDHGFLLRNGRFTTIDPPGSVGTSQANGIDDLGRIVGAICIATALSGDSFSIRAVTATSLSQRLNSRRLWNQRPGSNRRQLSMPMAFRTGSISRTEISRPFIRLAPWAPGHSGSTFSATSSAAGVPTQAALAASLTHFFSPPRGYRNLRFPGAHETVAHGINTVGQIVGNYFGVDGQFHGFVRDP